MSEDFFFLFSWEILHFTFFSIDYIYIYICSHIYQEALKKYLVELVYTVYAVLSMRNYVIVNLAVNTQREKPACLFSCFLHVYFTIYCIYIYTIMFHSTPLPCFCAASLPIERWFFWASNCIHLISQLCFG